MDPTAWLTDYGLFGLALLAFLGATLLPFSSEVAVVAALAAGWPPGAVFVSASLGNSLGASLNYGLGRIFAPKIEARLGTSRAGRQALRWSARHGRWSLLGSWLPIVGDPLCLAAGLIRVGGAFFVAVGLGTRLARYAALIWIFGVGTS